MKNKVFGTCIFLPLLVIVCGVVAADERLPLRTPLDDYIQKPDGSYTWKVGGSKSVGGMKSVVVEMVSQTWRTKEEVDRPQWRHWITLAFPEKSTSDIGMHFIGGGGNGGDPPDVAEARPMSIAP